MAETHQKGSRTDRLIMSDSKKTGLVFSNEYLNHITGDGHPERPSRAEIVMKGLIDSGLLDQMERIPVRLATQEEVTRCHAPSYYQLAKSDVEHGMSTLSTGDTQIMERSFDVALLAAGQVAADRVRLP